MNDAEVAIDAMANWSPWRPWAGARAEAPRLPGVYLFRVDDVIVYCGMAGERAGRDGTRAPKGLWGRLGRYESGRAAASGFGEHALDRALADPAFLRARLDHLERQGPERIITWARAALAWIPLEVRWATTTSGQEALALEAAVTQRLAVSGVRLWSVRSADDAATGSVAP